MRFGHCTECLIRFTNYLFYLREKEKGTWEDADTPSEPLPVESRPRPQ